MRADSCANLESFDVLIIDLQDARQKKSTSESTLSWSLVTDRESLDLV